MAAPVPRYDKYDGKVGGYRAVLAEDWTDPALHDKIIGVGHNSTGLIVKGAGQTGLRGVIIIPGGSNRKYKAGDVVDIMTAGEITGLANNAGVNLYVDGTTGNLTTTAPASGARGYQVGHTVEKSVEKGARAIVRFQPVVGV